MRRWLAIGAANGFVAVAFGSFAAHSLEGGVSEKALDWIATGLDYQMAHALALLAVAWLAGRGGGRWVEVAGWAFLAGSVLFSGTLYVMALSGAEGLGIVVPVGGIAFLVGWAALFLSAWRGDSASV
jgi:uncharacterized membrane protein YgdD (TMEM256/DUF423 family)